MKTTTYFKKFKSSIAIVIAIFMLTDVGSAEESTNGFQNKNTKDVSKEVSTNESSNAFTALSEIIGQIESTIKFDGSSLTDDEGNNLMRSHKNKSIKPVNFKGTKTNSSSISCNKTNNSNNIECENGNAFTALSEIIKQIESTIKFKGSLILNEEDSNLMLNQNKSNTISSKLTNLELKASEPKCKKNNKNIIECENGNAFTALAYIISQIENTIKFKGTSIQDDEESNTVLTQNNKVNIGVRFISYESKSDNSNDKDLITNKQELTDWLQKNLDHELKSKFDTKKGKLKIYLEVNKNGTLDNCKLTQASDPEIDRIVIKLISQAPLKMQVFENGYSAKQRFEIPIRYDIKFY